jgi:zinc/manganese transport system substrate-binding protein
MRTLYKCLQRVAVAMALISPILAHAALNVFACEPEWAALTQELAGERVKVFTATTALQDPHRIEARPSLIARMRQADLVVCTGAELESGWLPLLLEQAGNARVRPGSAGYFEAAGFVALLDRPATLDRSQGDVHAAGNPHIQQDPRRLLPVAEALAARLKQLDAGNAAGYEQTLARFRTTWNAHLARWEKDAAPLAGLPVAVQHASPYLVEWLGVKPVATLEPKPGVEPSSAYLAQVAAGLKKTPARLVLRAAYQDARPADWLAAQSGLPVAVLPFTVGGSPAAKDLVGLYDDTMRRLLEAAGRSAGGR